MYEKSLEYIPDLYEKSTVDMQREGLIFLWGHNYYELERYEEAEDLLLGSYSVIKRQFGEEHRRTQAVLKKIIDLYEALCRSEKAAKYRALLKDDTTKK